jgi:hypothetical protein
MNVKKNKKENKFVLMGCKSVEKGKEKSKYLSDSEIDVQYLSLSLSLSLSLREYRS